VRAWARASNVPHPNAQKSNGTPVMKATGIDAFMFWLFVKSCG
jgi:hypothetical protein